MKLTEQHIADIPLSTSGEFDLNDREAKAARRFIYSVNRDGIRRYRTQREGRLLFVWRIK